MITTEENATQGSAGPEETGPVDVCDGCRLVAYDAGIKDGETQAHAMATAGDVLPDHLCDAKEEPEYYPEGCGCGCYHPARARRRTAGG